MQLFALDQNGNHVLVEHARRHVDYHCPECSGQLRLREGSVRRAHFYHKHPVEDCRQNNKSIEHLQVQWRLFDLIPCSLEWRFPEINRIADVVWESEKLIFEVQCSPISAEEVHARHRDYENLGYRVIWILHDRRYNRRKVYPVEHAPHYYTNIDEEGKGMIYDQFDLVQGNSRKTTFAPLVVDLTQPVPFPNHHPLKLVMDRSKVYPCAFQGDLAHVDDPEYINSAKSFEKSFKPKKIFERLIQACKVFEMFLLEKVCK